MGTNIVSLEEPQERRGWFTRRFSAKTRIRLVGAAGGVLLALLIAPATRRLFLTQIGLTLPVPATVASVAGAEVGIHPDPFEGDIAFRAAHAVAAQHPNDLQMQIANATIPDANTNDSKRKVQQLRALEDRFPDQPALYANILRYEAQGDVQSRQMIRQFEFAGNAITADVRRIAAQQIDQAAYAAYDRDAAAGERLDPENAYFPIMRAVGLFGTGRSAEALAEVQLASRKSQWREYYDEELQGQWRLQDATCINNSALFHTLSAASLLFPQYAQMRAAIRLTVYSAMQAEQAGRIDEGLALRQAALRVGSLMRQQARNLIGSIVGIAFTEIAIARPDGVPSIKYSEPTEKQDREKVRRQFDAYLQDANRETELAAFHAEQKASDEIRGLVNDGMQYGPFEHLQVLLRWWMLDLLTLSNILWLLVFGGIATLFLRRRGTQAELRLPRQARLALPLGFIGGVIAAPIVLTRSAACFNQIAGVEAEYSGVLLGGYMIALLVLLLPAKTGQERLARLGIFGAALLSAMALTGFYCWQMRGITSIAYLVLVGLNLSNVKGYGGMDPAQVVQWITAAVPLLICLVAFITSLACRVPLTIGLARAFRGLTAPVAAALFLAYGGLMLCTVREEAATQYSLNRSLENENRYIADSSGKLWPRADVAKQLIGY